MAHKHFCLDCDCVIAQGNFDCEFDSDHDFELCRTCERLHVLRNHEVGRCEFEGAGQYWFTSPDRGSADIPLGYCHDELEMLDGALRAIQAGGGDENWRGWHLEKALT